MEHTNVKILAISDVPSKALWDYDTRARLEGIDLILSCGDLPKKYLEYLTNFTAAPILYVHGNHDGSYQTEGEPGGCICVDDQVYTWKGLRIMGLGGCQRYNKEDTYQYTEKAMRRRAHKLEHQAHKKGGIDLLLTHAPAKGNAADTPQYKPAAASPKRPDATAALIHKEADCNARRHALQSAIHSWTSSAPTNQSPLARTPLS